MKARAAFAIFLGAALLPASGLAAPRANTPENIVREIRREILALPNYGLFDSITFTLEGDTVILSGYASRPTLRESAASVVKDIAGVERVENRIEVLPLSRFDDEIRAAVVADIPRRYAGLRTQLALYDFTVFHGLPEPLLLSESPFIDWRVRARPPVPFVSMPLGPYCLLVGTPSGVTLAPEGGAHQSTVTPSLGIELPNVVFYEPAFANEVEWITLEAMRQCCDRENGYSTYLRLSTKSIEQGIGKPVIRGLTHNRVVTLDNLSRGYRSAVTHGELVVGDTGDRTLVLDTLRRHGAGGAPVYFFSERT